MLNITANLFCFTLLSAGNMNVAAAVLHGARADALLSSGRSGNGMRGKSKGGRVDAKSVYLTVTMIILANGGMLSAINRDFPVSLRPAAMNWMWATLVVAAGCVTFAVGGWLPRTLSVLVANSCLLQGSAFITGRSEHSRTSAAICFHGWSLVLA
ncbi:hypothetical protein DEA98_24795 [Brucella pseudogrignonensis]|nr:hypothetical protein [Brucella pseudogrignonensis]